MHIAQQGHSARIVELERALLALRPGAQVVTEFLVTAHVGPENVVRDFVAIQELDGSAGLHDSNVWLKKQALLVYYGTLGWRGKGLALNCVHVDDRLAGHAGNFAV